MQKNPVCLLHEQAKVFRGSTVLKSYPEVSGDVQRVGECDNVGCVGVETGLDGGWFHGGWLRTLPLQNRYLSSKLCVYMHTT